MGVEEERSSDVQQKWTRGYLDGFYHMIGSSARTSQSQSQPVPYHPPRGFAPTQESRYIAEPEMSCMSIACYIRTSTTFALFRSTNLSTSSTIHLGSFAPTLDLVFKSPVRSGLLASKAFNRDRDRSSSVRRP